MSYADQAMSTEFEKITDVRYMPHWINKIWGKIPKTPRVLELKQMGERPMLIEEDYNKVLEMADGDWQKAEIEEIRAMFFDPASWGTQIHVDMGLSKIEEISQRRTRKIKREMWWIAGAILLIPTILPKIVPQIMKIFPKMAKTMQPMDMVKIYAITKIMEMGGQILTNLDHMSTEIIRLRTSATTGNMKMLLKTTSDKITVLERRLMKIQGDRDDQWRFAKQILETECISTEAGSARWRAHLLEMSATKLKQMGGRIEKISEEQITTFGEEIKTLFNTEIEKSG